MIVRHYDLKYQRLQDKIIHKPLIKPEINGNDTFEFEYNGVNVFSKYDFICFEYQGEDKEYIVSKVEESAASGSKVYCENSITDLKFIPIEAKIYSSNTNEIVNDIFRGSAWHIGTVDDPNMSFFLSTEDSNSYDVLGRFLKLTALELETEVHFSDDSPPYRVAHLKKKIGYDRGIRLERQNYLKDLKRTKVDEDVYTAVFAMSSGADIPKSREEMERKRQMEISKEEQEKWRQEKKQKEEIYKKEVEKVKALREAEQKRRAAERDKVTKKKKRKYKRIKRPSVNELYPLPKRPDYGERPERTRYEKSRYTTTLTCDSETLEKYGRYMGNDEPRHRWATKVFEWCESQGELERAAKEFLDYYSKPRAEYEAIADNIPELDGIGLGDWVTIIDDDLGAQLKSRVVEQEIYPDQKMHKITISNFREDRKGVSTIATHISNRISQETETILSKKLVEERTYLMNEMGQKVNWGENEPQEASKGDVWFRENLDNTMDLLIWNGSEWEVKAGATYTKALEEQIDTVMDEATEDFMLAIEYGKNILANERPEDLIEQSKSLSSGGYIEFTYPYKAEKDKDYILGFDIQSDADCISSLLVSGNANNVKPENEAFISIDGTSGLRLFHSFKALENGNNNIKIKVSSNGRPGNVSIKNIKLEAGNVSTNFTLPAETAGNFVAKIGDRIITTLKKNDLVTLINQQAGKFMVATAEGEKLNYINLTPETCAIANATIKDAMIKSISASKLTAGTIDASKITVINLDAGSITSGILNANLIRTGKIQDYRGNFEIDLDNSSINIGNRFMYDPSKGLRVSGNSLFGTIDARSINVDNLNANNITSGVLSRGVDNGSCYLPERGAATIRGGGDSLTMGQGYRYIENDYGYKNTFLVEGRITATPEGNHHALELNGLTVDNRSASGAFKCENGRTRLSSGYGDALYIESGSGTTIMANDTHVQGVLNCRELWVDGVKKF